MDSTRFWKHSSEIFGQFYHDTIIQLLHIHQLNIHHVNPPFHHIPEVLYWWSSGNCGVHELAGVFKEPLWIIWALWHSILFYLKHPSEVECMAGIKGWIWSETILRWAVVFKSCLLETISKLGQENILQTIELPPSAWTGNTRQDGVMVSSCLHQILSQWDSRLIRRNNIFLIFYSGEPCSYLTGAISGLVFFCYRFDVLCFQRCSFAYLRCNECLSYCCLPTSLM